MFIGNVRNAGKLQLNLKKKYIYIYIYIYVCVCVCRSKNYSKREKQALIMKNSKWKSFQSGSLTEKKNCRFQKMLIVICENSQWSRTLCNNWRKSVTYLPVQGSSPVLWMMSVLYEEEDTSRLLLLELRFSWPCGSWRGVFRMT